MTAYCLDTCAMSRLPHMLSPSLMIKGKFGRERTCTDPPPPHTHMLQQWCLGYILPCLPKWPKMHNMHVHEFASESNRKLLHYNGILLNKLQSMPFEYTYNISSYKRSHTLENKMIPVKIFVCRPFNLAVGYFYGTKWRVVVWQIPVSNHFV